jgi:phospholipid/cholesterol/gamma-HCH transport system substrate-binding protein
MSRLIRPLREYHPFWLGVVASGVIVAIVLGALAIGELGIGKSRYQAEFVTSGGMRPGDEVRVAGLTVGSVTGVGLEGDHVLIKFRVDGGVPVGADSAASIKLATLLGTRYLELRPAGPAQLKDNRIPLARTSVPYNVQDVIQKGTPIVEQLDGAKLRDALAATATNLQGEGPRIGAALTGLSRLSDVVVKRRDQVAELINNLDAVADLVDRRNDQIYALLGQTDTLASNLVRRRDLIRGTLDDLVGFTHELRGVLKDNQHEARPLLDKARQLTDLLHQQDDAINRALQLIAPAGRYLTNASGNGPYLELYAPYFIVPENLLCRAQAIPGCSQ